MYLLNHFSNRKLPPLLAQENDVHKCAALLRQARDEMFAAMNNNFHGRLHNPEHNTVLWGFGGDDGPDD